nr:hypothetical protein [Tanacetum cinerariifolium]
MATTIEQQTALDESLVPSTQRLRIGRSNFRLPSDIQSKEATLQVVYDVLRNSPLFRDFQVTADVPEIYMQEFWATAKLHHNSIRFKIDTRKSVLDLEAFREMLHISLRIPNQPFADLPTEEEILEFLRFLGHSHDIRYLTDAQILWGLYHKRNVDFTYLLWEDFIYQVEHKDKKKRNEMYYLRFRKVIIHYFMSKDPSIPRRNKVNWHYVRDDQMFTTIKLVSRHQNTQQFGSMLSIELTNADIRNSKAYKEYYAVAIGATSPKTKARVQKTKSSSDTTVTPPLTAAVGTRLSTSAKGKQLAKASKAKSLTTLFEVAMTEAEQLKVATKRSLQQTHISQASGSGTDEGTSTIPGVLDVPTDESDEEISWKSSDEGKDDDDDQDEGDDDDNQEEGNDDDQDSDEGGEEFIHPREEGQDEDELDRDVNINLEGRVVQMADVHTTQEFKDSHVTLTSINPDGQQQKTEEFLKNLDENIQKIIKEQVKEQVKVQVSKILPKIEQTVNEQLEAEVLTRASNSSKTSYVVAADLLEMELKKILIEKMEGNKSIHRSNEQMNLYKALVEAYESDKIILDTYGDTVKLKRRKEPESASALKEKATKSAGKSTQGSKSQKMSTSEFTTAEEPMQTTHEMEDPSHPEFETGVDDQPNAEPSQHPEWFSQQKIPPTLDRDWNKTLPATHGSIQLWISELAKQTDSRFSFNALMDTPMDFSAFLMNRLKVDTLTPELLAGPTYELMNGSYKSLVEIEYFLEEFYKATTDQLDWINPEGQQYPHNLLKPLPLIPNSRGHRVIPFDHFINNDLEYLRGGASSRKYTTSATTSMLSGESLIGGERQQFYGFAVNRESARDVYSKRRIIAVTELKIVEWHNYKHLDWITVRRDDDKLYKFKEGDFKRLRIQDIEDMHMEDLQLDVESYQKKLNLTRPDTYHSDLKRKEAYTAYSNPRGFIYKNKDKQNRLMRIDELHKFSDGTLTDVCTTLDDRLKRIRMKYKLVRHRYSNPMIQPEPEGSTQGYPLVSVEVLRYDKRSKSKNMEIVPTKMELILEHNQQGNIKGEWRYLFPAEPQFITTCSYPTIKTSATLMYSNRKNNPEGKEYPFDLSKPLPLIMVQGHQVVPINYIINNDLEYLRGKAKARNIRLLQQKQRLLITKVKVMKWYDYGNLEEIEVRREDQQLYKFKDGDFPRLHLHDIKDMLLLLVQKKLFNLIRDVIFYLGVVLRMFTKRIVILKWVEDLQMGVKSYQKKLNNTMPETFRFDISNRTPYTAYNNPQGIIYADKYNRNRLMHSVEIHMFSDGTLASIRNVLCDIASNLRMDYLPKRRWSNLDIQRSRIMIKPIDKLLLERSITTHNFLQCYKKVNKELGKVLWWERLRRRLQTA